MTLDWTPLITRLLFFAVYNLFLFFFFGLNKSLQGCQIPLVLHLSV